MPDRLFWKNIVLAVGFCMLVMYKKIFLRPGYSGQDKLAPVQGLPFTQTSYCSFITIFINNVPCKCNNNAWWVASYKFLLIKESYQELIWKSSCIKIFICLFKNIYIIQMPVLVLYWIISDSWIMSEFSIFTLKLYKMPNIQ